MSCVVLGVTGGIAAYKSAEIASQLKKQGHDVYVIMTKHATEFIAPLTFETLTNHPVVVDMFTRETPWEVEHIALAKRADVFLVAPASANFLGKYANGIADDMLTTTVMACPCKKIISPAMNHNMYHNPIVQDNIEKLARFGYEIIPPETGMLANGDSGDGRMPDERLLLEYIRKEIACEKDLAGKKVLVTAGATREAIDPVRFITNHSTGKMGFALAHAAMLRGAEVTLVAAHTEAEAPLLVNVVRVTSAQDMFEAVKERAEESDVIIKAAAVADYTPVTTADHKIKKAEGGLSIELTRTRDILKYLGEHKREGQVLCGFAMETEELLANAKKKLESKHCDLICANSLRKAGAGFGTDTNCVTVLTKDGERELPLLSKEETAHEILNEICKKLGS